MSKDIAKLLMELYNIIFEDEDPYKNKLIELFCGKNRDLFSNWANRDNKILSYDKIIDMIEYCGAQEEPQEYNSEYNLDANMFDSSGKLRG